MIGWDDVYSVVASMFPLFVALMLGYGSVKWWRLFTHEQCDGINRFIALFILPLFGFEFTAHINPYAMNLRLLAADALSKLATLTILALWGRFSSRASYNWCITMFSLCTLTNRLVVGVPVIRPMYGQRGVDLVVQLCMIQSLVWTPLLLLFLEFRKTRMMDLATSSPPPPAENNGVIDEESVIEMSVVNTSDGSDDDHEKRSYWSFTRVVWMKMAMNPNVYANALGLAWALMASRFKFTMPSIMEGSVEIMSKAGTGTAMFNIGIFIAMQTKVIACGTWPTVLGMVSRFVVGPSVMALCSLAVGLHGPALRIGIIQAALPQAITSFVFAKEYGLHANVLSTAVVFGTLISLPLLIGYYIGLEYTS
ncbi:auxin efflux carrier component 5-like [Syzygium oleosum]|uniref:auxin efflux carrier component 5-like n=1 Tax=Syzygium oleosum TaxID=219896 RepID=UPI0011D277AE|nr:auxin efflux carrier component 5-like [Syzygium oleosum]